MGLSRKDSRTADILFECYGGLVNHYYDAHNYNIYKISNNINWKIWKIYFALKFKQCWHHIWCWQGGDKIWNLNPHTAEVVGGGGGGRRRRWQPKSNAIAIQSPSLLPNMTNGSYSHRVETFSFKFYIFSHLLSALICEGNTIAWNIFKGTSSQIGLLSIIVSIISITCSS